MINIGSRLSLESSFANAIEDFFCLNFLEKLIKVKPIKVV
jgi:hypothetical protein